MFLLYPQVSWAQAETEARRFAELSAETIRNELSPAGNQADGAVYSAVGGVPVTPEKLTLIRSRAVGIATDLGYPEGQTETDATKLFDAGVAALLHSEMGLSPNEASRKWVWQFISCYLLPDLVRWRFPGQSGAGTSVARFKGGVRNTFQRLWWRAETLQLADADERYQLLTQLNEDELVQIMERPAVGGHRRLSRSVAIAFLVELSRDERLERELLMREAQKRIIRLLPFVTFGSLSSGEMNTIVTQVISDTAKAIGKPAAGDETERDRAAQ